MKRYFLGSSIAYFIIGLLAAITRPDLDWLLLAAVVGLLFFGRILFRKQIHVWIVLVFGCLVGLLGVGMLIALGL